MPAAKPINIGITKAGPGGRPAAQIQVDKGVSLDALSATIQKQVTRNTDLLKKLGLRACGTCISGLDLDIRHRFDHVLTVDLEKIG